jgi:hypothetical protein
MQAVNQGIEERKKALEDSKVYKQQQEEYEQLTRLIMQHPKQSKTKEEIAAVEAEILDLKRESDILDAALEVRLSAEL